MIYNKPRDINLRVIPSLSSLVPEKLTKRTAIPEEALSDSKSLKNVIQTKPEDVSSGTPSALPLDNPDVIITEKPSFAPKLSNEITGDEPVIDLTELPIIDGIPILELKDLTVNKEIIIPSEAIENTSFEESLDKEPQKEATIPDFGEVEIDISEMPDIFGIPMLELPDKPVTPPIVEAEETAPVTDAIAQENRAEHTPEIPVIEKEETNKPQATDKAAEKALVKEQKRLEKQKAAEALRIAKEEEKRLAKEERDKKRLAAQERRAEKERAKKQAKQIKEKTQLAKKEKKKADFASKVNKLKNKKLTNKARLLKTASFFLMLYAGTILAFIIPLRPVYSETEKRKLAEFPDFTAEAFVSGDYFSDISTWFSDTFPFREALTKANTEIKNLYGFDTIAIHGDVEQGDEIPDIPLEQPPVEETKPQPKPQAPVTMPDEEDLKTDNGDPSAARPDYNTQSLGAIIVANDSAYEYYSFSEDLAPRFINSVSSIKNAAHNKSNVYAMIAPTSIDIKLNDALRSDISSANQKKALDYFNASFKNSIVVDGIYEAERLHRNEYTYFRTDHHWTALGAYYAYEQFAQTKGIKPIPLSKYKTRTFDGFLGTFYSGSGQTAKLAETPDKVTAYLPFNKTTCHIVEGNGNEFDWDVIKDVTDYDPGMKYITFIGGDNAITTITNHDNPNGETCIVIKESFGNAFVPFLIPHYSTIYVIDPRHYDGTLSEFTQDKVINDIILLVNISTTRNYLYIDAMEALIQ
ncbi:MAG: hypothetical protein J6D06_00890 [Clostridia bacterium]|nr:hypothetical protein [Clostridia bacterium]